MNADFYIEKLKGRVVESPGSRLFLTLAEELRKRGQMEEAFMVLANGIERNPTFASARLTMGRWYLKEGRLEEAKKEFSAVLDIMPEDRFAIRYLKDISAAVAETSNAARRRTIEHLNLFLDGIKKRFPSDAPGDLTGGCC